MKGKKKKKLLQILLITVSAFTCINEPEKFRVVEWGKNIFSRSASRKIIKHIRQWPNK